jgi:hypothetical protein
MDLNAGKALQLLRLHGDFLSETNLPGGTLDERYTVGIEGFVHGGRTRLRANQRYTLCLDCLDVFEVALSDGFNDGGLHGKLDPVERDEPDYILMPLRSMTAVVDADMATYPNPDDTNPTTRNRMNLGETPVSVRCDDGRYELCDAESPHQGI